MQVERDQHAVRDLLVQKLSGFQAKNPQFSLRAFARKLDVDPGFLSRILNGKRRVTRALAERFCRAMMLDPTETARILSHFPQRRRQVSKMDQVDASYLQLTADQFRIVSDWYYFGILSLIRTDDFQSDPEWIAKRLGIRVDETKRALDRLSRLEMIEKDSRNQWCRTQVSLETTDEVLDLSIRKSHLQTLDLAKASIEKDSNSERDFTATTMAIDPSRIDEAKVLIRQFQDDMDSLLEGQSRNKKEVYRLMVGLFPLTRKEKKGNTK